MDICQVTLLHVNYHIASWESEVFIVLFQVVWKLLDSQVSSQVSQINT